MAAWNNTDVLIAFAISFSAGLATLVGGLMVVLFKKPSFRVLAFGLAFSAGAMVYLSLTELLGKSIESFSLKFDSQLGYSYATLTFLAGLLIILLLDRLVPNPHTIIDKHNSKELGQQQLRRTGILTMLAITAHNVPEGMATFFASLESPTLGIPLAMAIAIHNIPEGIAIAVPIYMATGKKSWAVLASLISGLAEPFGAFLGYTILAPFMGPVVYGTVFGLIGGVMVYLALDELLPTAKRYSQGHETVYGLVAGMVVIALSLVAFQFI